jgi:lipopolysaccharide/colanic/teichoic acid biosynthesis glycosyltransferase
MAVIAGSQPGLESQRAIVGPGPTLLRGARTDSRRLLLLALVGFDALALVLAVGGAGVLRLGIDEVLPISSLATERLVVASVLVVPILLLLFKIHGLYDLDHLLIGTREYAKIAHAATYGVLVVLAVSYFAGSGPLVSRSWVLLVWALTIGCAGLGRFGARRVVRWLRRRGALRTRVVIVGASTAGITIAEQLSAARNEGLDVVGFLDEYLPLGQALLPGVEVIGRPNDVTKIDLADEYVLVPGALPHERLEAITRLMVSRTGPVLRMAVSPSELLTHRMLVTERGSVPLITLQQARLTGLEAALKRAVDLAGGCLLLVALAPLVATLLARAWLAGHRPLMYRERVYGSGDRPVALWLLDSRVSTWLALRGVPALLAVLGGHLSLVGPRPITCSPGALARPPTWLTAVKPGLTGPWRLSGPGASLADQVLNDLTYVRTYTIWEDLRILWASLGRLRRDGAAPLLGRWQAPTVAAGADDGAESTLFGRKTGASNALPSPNGGSIQVAPDER